MAQKRNIVEAAMRNNNLVFFFMAVIVIFGFFALPRLKKNEFPDVTIRTGVVAVVYPGATAKRLSKGWQVLQNSICLHSPMSIKTRRIHIRETACSSSWSIW